MSDTTTITAEERAEIRAHFERKYTDPCREAEYGRTACLRLLDALEQAETSAEQAKKELVGADYEIAELRDELEDSRGTEKDAPHKLCEIARMIGVYEHCQELGDDMGTMALEAVQDLIADKQRAEANVAQLTKERDWLADKCAMHCHDKDRDDILCSDDACDVSSLTCVGASACDWKEAASRAVAAGEG